MLSPVLSACSHAQTPSPVRELSSGWYNRPPYQMLEPSKGGNVVTGLEIKAAQELFDNAGYQVSFESMSWSDMLASLKTGSIDFVMGAYYEKSRAEYCYYSIPYRYEKNAIYIHKGISGTDSIESMNDLLEFLEVNSLRMAAIGSVDEYVYGSDSFADFLKSSPDNLFLVPSKGYNESMNLVLQGHADFFVANPVIADRILAKTSHASQIKKIEGLFPEIPVHVMFSKETITPEQVAGFNEIIESMINDNRFRSLHIEFLLPVYLSITTEQFWFDLLTLLGIVAFCFSGVLIARKERYNLVGALVLSILPAIGGGVLRDIFLGADKVFVLKTPAFMLVAVGVVILSFLGFKSYDYFTFRYRKKVSRLKIFAPKHLEGMFNRLFKFFDAWAVATFTIVGVNAAVESQVTPLWLWGPAMGALTASGGVVLRDIVRAEFNIEMLKQDSYAEISIFGGIIYTGALLVLRYDITQNLIFYLTMFMIVFLFAIRFFILWKGWVNPLQFGADRTHPDARMKEFERLEPEL
ncbi:MAG: TRIC cation channel family protein, partial [Desulfonatronovibrio sp.]